LYYKFSYKIIDQFIQYRSPIFEIFGSKKRFKIDLISAIGRPYQNWF